MKSTSTRLLLCGILLIASNLRLPITSIGPVMQDIGSSWHLGSSALGLLTTLPLLAFALISPLAPLLSQRIGLKRSLGLSLVLIIIGFTGRLLPVLPMLYVGTALLGAGIAIGNVLLPSLVKQRFPERIALITSVYAFTMGVAAAAGSALVIPLMQTLAWSWAQALFAFVGLTILSLLVWLPQLKAEPAATKHAAQQTTNVTTAQWKHCLAWQVTAFLGVNSLIYYSIITWLPSMLQAAGYSASAAGSIHGLLQLFSALPGLVIVPLMAKFEDQVIPTALVCVCMLLGLLGLNLWPQAASVWAAMIGFGSGGAIILGLMFMGLRTRTPARAAALSGMAQCLGYLLAALAPPLLGLLQQAQQHWHGVLWILSAAAIIVLINGLLSGRKRCLP